jgi:Cu/Zn superoxide dismutase
VGDLSGKHGAFSGNVTEVTSYSDANLPLFGQYSVLGRSVVLHASAGGARLACADIVAWGPSESKLVSAQFTGGVQGAIAMFQSNPVALTDVSVSLTGLTNGPNKYHVHQFPIITPGDCGKAAGHYNPDR